ncbi:MAG: Fe-S cluster assembly protein SufD [Proteobacteria bacterium]|nr:Fe-S cluster assembly protein SufD [Pseudomonadota bacterium]MDA1355889.1 Fe-S cluster assembly protein SufD [Pseudomonadota bacterium]
MGTVLPRASRAGRSIDLPYAAKFASIRADLPGRDLPWITSGRDAAMARFSELGLPSQKVEDWKYSNLSPLAKTDFTGPDRKAVEAARDEVAQRFPKESTAGRLVFINGMLDGPLSAMENLPVGVRVIGLADAMTGESDLLKAQMDDAVPALNGHALAALNAAFMADGCLILLEPDAELALELLFVAAPDVGAVAYHPHISIAVGAGSRLLLGEQHASLGDLEYWSNPVTAMRLGEAAQVRHYKLQEESRRAWQTSLTQARLAAGATYENFIVATGGRYVRNEIEVALKGSGASCELGGSFLLAGEQQVDNRLLVDHVAPNGTSRQTYKGVLDEHSHGVFQGKTVVHRDAQKSDGNQLSRALLLSPDAIMDAKPELKIYADDVKCSHGATVGELDDEQLFYLRARGIDEASARNLLIAAFMEEHLQSITDDAARDWLRGAVSVWLAQRLSAGEG